MSEEFSTLSIRIPRSMHDELKAEAKSAGSNLTKLVTPLLEARHKQSSNLPKGDLIGLLTPVRSSARFGDETILEEIRRRIISMQLISVHGLTSNMAANEAHDFMAELDDKVRDLISSRVPEDR